MLDVDDLHTLTETAVGPGPYALAAVQEAGHVFAALTGGDEVAMLDASGNLLTTTHLGGLGFPQGLAVDAGMAAFTSATPWRRATAREF